MAMNIWDWGTFAVGFGLTAALIIVLGILAKKKHSKSALEKKRRRLAAAMDALEKALPRYSSETINGRLAEMQDAWNFWLTDDELTRIGQLEKAAQAVLLDIETGHRWQAYCDAQAGKTASYSAEGALAILLADSNVEGWAARNDVNVEELRNTMHDIALAWVTNLTDPEIKQFELACADYRLYLTALPEHAEIARAWSNLLARSFAQPTLAQYVTKEFPPLAQLALYATGVWRKEEDIAEAKRLLAYWAENSAAHEQLAPVARDLLLFIDDYNTEAGLSV